MREASPSPVYGAALLMRFGTSIPSRVQIPPPPRQDPKPRSTRTGASAFGGAAARSPSSQGVRQTDFTWRRQSCNVLPVAASGPKARERDNNKTSTRSLTDRASDYGSEGCRFESCRVHTGERPRRDPGPLAFQSRTAAKCSNRVNRSPIVSDSSLIAARACSSLAAEWTSIVMAISSATGCAVPPLGGPGPRGRPGASCMCAGCSAGG